MQLLKTRNFVTNQLHVATENLKQFTANLAKSTFAVNRYLYLRLNQQQNNGSQVVYCNQFCTIACTINQKSQPLLQMHQIQIVQCPHCTFLLCTSKMWNIHTKMKLDWVLKHYVLMWETAESKFVRWRRTTNLLNPIRYYQHLKIHLRFSLFCTRCLCIYCTEKSMRNQLSDYHKCHITLICKSEQFSRSEDQCAYNEKWWLL